MKNYIREHHDHIKVRAQYYHYRTPHFHDAIELIFMLDGEMTAYYNGTPYALKPGDVFISGVNTIHCYHHTEACNSIVMIAEPAFLYGAATAFKDMYPDYPVWSDPQKSSKIWEMIRLALELYRKADQQTLALLLSSMLGLMLKDLDMKKSIATVKSAQGILDYCKSHYTEQITIDQIASALSSSKSHISHTFSNVLKISFPDYINQLRLTKAIKLMEDPRLSLAQIATASGYASIRNFNRVFLKHYGSTPAKYRKHHIALPDGEWSGV